MRRYRNCLVQLKWMCLSVCISPTVLLLISAPSPPCNHEQQAELMSEFPTPPAQCSAEKAKYEHYKKRVKGWAGYYYKLSIFNATYWKKWHGSCHTMLRM